MDTVTFGSLQEKSLLTIAKKAKDKVEHATHNLERIKNAVIKDLQIIMRALPERSFDFKEMVEFVPFYDYMEGRIDCPIAITDTTKAAQSVNRVFLDDDLLMVDTTETFHIPAEQLPVETLCMLLETIEDFTQSYCEFMQYFDPESDDEIPVDLMFYED